MTDADWLRYMSNGDLWIGSVMATAGFAIWAKSGGPLIAAGIFYTLLGLALRWQP